MASSLGRGFLPDIARTKIAAEAVKRKVSSSCIYMPLLLSEIIQNLIGGSANARRPTRDRDPNRSS
jgi:hypothetical protein